MAYKRKIDINPFNSIASILIMVLVFVALYWVATTVFDILLWLSPFLIIATLIIDYRVILSYGKWLWNLLKKNPFLGIGGVLLTIFGFPIISGFLLAKAWLYRKVNKMKNDIETQNQGEFAEYEEIEEEPKIRLELPDINSPKKNKKSDYDQYFD